MYYLILGTIPTEFGSWSNLVYLSLENNSFVGMKLYVVFIGV